MMGLCAKYSLLVSSSLIRGFCNPNFHTSRIVCEHGLVMRRLGDALG